MKFLREVYLVGIIVARHISPPFGPTKSCIDVQAMNILLAKGSISYFMMRAKTESNHNVIRIYCASPVNYLIYIRIVL